IHIFLTTLKFPQLTFQYSIFITGIFGLYIKYFIYIRIALQMRHYLPISAIIFKVNHGHLKIFEHKHTRILIILLEIAEDNKSNEKSHYSPAGNSCFCCLWHDGRRRSNIYIQSKVRGYSLENLPGKLSISCT